MLITILQPHHSPYRLLRPAWLTLLLFLSLSSAAGTSPAQRSENIPVLELGKPIERELASGQAHSYRIALASDQYLRVIVDQRGIDVVAALFGPDGKPIIETDSPNGKHGLEIVSAIAQNSGSYRLEVRSPEKGTTRGRYKVKIEELRSPTAQDKSSVAAQQAFMQAELLRAQATAESLQKSIVLYEESQRIRRGIGDRVGEATTLVTIGVVYEALGDTPKALGYYLQAPPLYHAAGDRADEAAMLLTIGGVYNDSGDKRGALSYYMRALPLFYALRDRDAEATTLLSIGMAYESSDDKKSLGYYMRALVLYRATGDRDSKAAALLAIAGFYNNSGDKRRSISYYTQALPLYQALGDRSTEATILNNIGKSYNSLGNRRKAISCYAQALLLYQALGDRRSEATMLAAIGKLYSVSGDKQKAIDYYAKLLSLCRAAEDIRAEAVTLTAIGEVYDNSSDKQKALDYYLQALPLYRAVNDRRNEATMLSNIGLLYDALGDKRKALDYYKQALPLYRHAEDHRAEAATLIAIGEVHDDSGEWETALEYYLQAQPLYQAAKDPAGEAMTLNNIGIIYGLIGDKRKGLDYYKQALPLYHAAKDRTGEATSLSNIGDSYYAEGDRSKALSHYTRALQFFRAGADRRGMATTLNNIGVVYDDAGDKRKALGYYLRSLPLRRAVAERRGEATTLNNIGGVYNDLGERRKARDYYNQALTIRRDIADRRGEAITLASFAFTEREAGNLMEARARIEDALTIIESLRTRIVSPEMRSSYFAAAQDYYEFYIDLLMRLHKQSPSAGYLGAALQASERARARSLLELLTEARIDIRQGVDPDLVQREHALQEQLNSKAHSQMQLLNGPHTDEQATAISEEVKALITGLEQVKTQIRQNSPRYAALTQPTQLTLQGIQAQVLDADTLLLEYSLGAERSYLWAVTPTSITSYELPKRVEVEQAASEFYRILAGSNSIYTEPNREKSLATAKPDGPNQEHVETASRLSQMLLGPVSSQIGQKRLVIVANGALQYLPFAALLDPTSGNHGSETRQPLIAQHEIVNLPSISILPLLRKAMAEHAPATQILAILADPVFSPNDERVKKLSAQEKTSRPTLAPADADNVIRNASSGLQKAGPPQLGKGVERLPGSRKEAEGILALFPANQVRRAFDFDASRALVTSGELSRYRYVHFATHGLINRNHPELSAIVLSLVDEKGKPQDGYLRLHEIFNLNLPAEMVILSGCETELGKEIRGEGLIGLTRGFMYAGSARVMASLWRVEDEATAELMASFYKGMIGEGKRPAEALRAAQIEMLKHPEWRAPHYWAAFVLQGDWR